MSTFAKTHEVGQNWRVQRRQRAGVGFAQTSFVPGSAPFARTQFVPSSRETAHLPTCTLFERLAFPYAVGVSRTNEVCATACPLRRLHKAVDAARNAGLHEWGCAHRLGAYGNVCGIADLCISTNILILVHKISIDITDI